MEPGPGRTVGTLEIEHELGRGAFAPSTSHETGSSAAAWP